MLIKPPELLVFSEPHHIVIQIELSFNSNSVAVHLVLACASIACRDKGLRGQVDRAPAGSITTRK